jgi:hypothetical protein
MAISSRDEFLFGNFYKRENLVAFHQFLEEHFPIKENCAWTYERVYGKTVPWWSIAVTVCPTNGATFEVPLGSKKNLNPTPEDLFKAGIYPDPEAWYPVAYFERAFLMTEAEAKGWFELRGLTYEAGATVTMGEIEYIKPKNVTGAFREMTDSQRDEWLRPYLYGDGNAYISFKQEKDRRDRVLWKRKGKAPARYGHYSDKQIRDNFCKFYFFRGSDILNAKPLDLKTRKKLKENCREQYGEENIPKRKRRVGDGPILYWTYFGLRQDSVTTLMPQTHKIVFDRDEVKNQRARIQKCNFVMNSYDIAAHVMYPRWILDHVTFTDVGIKGKDIVDQLLFTGHTETGVLFAIKRKAVTGKLNKMFYGNGVTGGLRGLELHQWLDNNYPRKNIKYANIPITGLTCPMVLGADILEVLFNKPIPKYEKVIPSGYLYIPDRRPRNEIKFK